MIFVQQYPHPMHIRVFVSLYEIIYIRLLYTKISSASAYLITALYVMNTPLHYEVHLNALCID